MTIAAHEAMDKAFNGLGGWEALKRWAKDNETEFYKLWARRIPQQQIHSGDAEKPIQHEHAVIRWGDMEIPI